MISLGKRLKVIQKIEPVELFINFETKNKYFVLDEQDNKILYAYEESSVLARQFLRKHRNLKLHIIDENKNEVLLIERPFYFFKSKATIKFPDGRVLGFANQKKWFFKTKYDVVVKENNAFFNCISKWTHPWTFNIFINDQQAGQIVKKFSGKEIISDATNFEIDFGNITDEKTKYAVLAMAFIIDLERFER